MKVFIYRIFAIAFLFVGFASCTEEPADFEALTNNADGDQVYIAKAIRGLQSLKLFPYDEEQRSLSLGVNFGGLGLPANDISIKIEIDLTALDSINQLRIASGKEIYQLFPEDTYSLDRTEFVIPKGEQSSNIATITYYPLTFDNQIDYVLPLSITDVSGGYSVNPSAKTVFFVANKLELRPANTNGWGATASSKQDNGWENTGLASALLDGDVNTIWHSQYTPEYDTYPFTLEFDMVEPIFVGKIQIAPRQNNGNGPTKFYLEGSLDGSNWFRITGDLSFDPANIAHQEFGLDEAQELRNIRLVLTEGLGYTSFLSEFVVFTF